MSQAEDLRASHRPVGLTPMCADDALRAGETVITPCRLVQERSDLMRSMLFGLLALCGLAAFATSASACEYGKSAQASQTQQTAQAQTPSTAN